MTDENTALDLVRCYKDLIGKKMKTEGVLVTIDDIQMAQWENGQYDVVLVHYQKSEIYPNMTEEIRVCLWDYLNDMGLLHDLQKGITPPDPNQKYFTSDMNLAFIVADKFSYLTKSKKMFTVPTSNLGYEIDDVKVFMMPNTDEPNYQVLLVNDPIKNNSFLMKNDLRRIPSKDLIVYLQEIGYDISKDELLNGFIELYL